MQVSGERVEPRGAESREDDGELAGKEVLELSILVFAVTTPMEAVR
jgi:hypothetical protein